MNYHKMTVVQLKEELKKRNLPISGKKADLITRLMKYQEQNNIVEVPSGTYTLDELQAENGDLRNKTIKAGNINVSF